MLLWNEETRRNKGKEGVPGVAITDLKKKKKCNNGNDYPQIIKM